MVGYHTLQWVYDGSLPLSCPHTYDGTLQGTGELWGKCLKFHDLIPIIRTPNSIPLPQVTSSPAPDRYSNSRATPSLNPFTTSLPSPLSSSLLHTLSMAGGGASPGGMAGLTSSLISSVDGRSRQGLKETAVQYCLRIIDQSERSQSILALV